jgi:hypothetical protein
MAIARELLASNRAVSLLTLLDVPIVEVVGPEGYPGKSACFIGTKSRFNPLRRFRHPETGMAKYFPAGLMLGSMPADYAEFFTTAALADFTPQLRSALRWAEKPGAARGHRVGALPPSTYRTRYAALAPLSLPAGASATIAVSVENASRIVWEASRDSGIYLGNHWLTEDGEVVVWGDGRVPIRRVALRETVSIPLSVRAPAQPGDYLLEIDLVEEGVTWFKDKGAPALYVNVRVTGNAEAPKRRR